jgi:lipid-A-disaccharide synthase
MALPQILISAGETSGEMHAARLAAKLRARTGAHLFGLGGPRMHAAGVELLAESAQVAVVGFSEVFHRLPQIWSVYRRLAEEAERRRPQLAILVDFPDFNLRLARRLHKFGIRSVYFISPQVWAWRGGRVALMKRLVERVICIFPFEEKFYIDAGVPADYVGHPLVDIVRAATSRAEFCAQHSLDPANKIIALLPGSREREVAHHLPVMLEAAALLREKFSCQFVLALAAGISACLVSGQTRWEQHVRLVQSATYDALAYAEAAIVASGTATVECALLGTPMVVVYRLSPASAFLARRLVRVPYFAMPNLIAGRKIVPELFQEQATPQAIATEVSRLMDSSDAREAMKRDLAEARERLRGPGGDPIARAAEIIAGLL